MLQKLEEILARVHASAEEQPQPIVKVEMESVNEVVLPQPVAYGRYEGGVLGLKEECVAAVEHYEKYEHEGQGYEGKRKGYECNGYLVDKE